MQADRTELQEIQDVSQRNEDSKKSKKSTKNASKQSITVEEQVVFSLILSVNTFSNSIEDNYIEQKTQLKITKYQVLERNGIRRSDISEIVCSKIRPIPFSNMNDVRMKLRASLGKVYLNKKAKLSEVQELGINVKKTSQQLFEESINAYVVLSGLLKQASIPTPIQQGFYQQYSVMWQQFVQNLRKYNQQDHKHTLSKYKHRMLQIWFQIPHQSLTKHLETFDLRKQYGQLNQEMMIRQFTSLLVDNKIQQCCTYYETYCLTRLQTQTYLNISQQLRAFQDQVLIPKITKSDHIFSSHVLSLFKSNPQLKQRLLNSTELEPAVGVRIVDLLKQDGRKYYNIYIYCLRQHYKSIIYDHKYWWMVEDKLSFNKNFIEWYTEDLMKVIQGKQQNDKIEKIAKQIKDITNVEDLELSILERNKIIDFQHSKFKGKNFTKIQNPLYEKDRFDCSEIIIGEISSQQKQQSGSKYLRFEEFGVYQKDIRIIDKIDDSFEQMKQILLAYENKPIGFDTEFRCVSIKYEQQGVSLIQLSTQTHHFIVDFLKLQTSPEFNKFIIELLCNQNYIKVGHTISSDIRYLTLTLNIPQTMSIKSFIDITHIFKTLHPNQKFSSLSFLCLKFLNRKLSKYQQRSNWNRRPLRKAQVHYAALDAYACVLIYNKIVPEYYDILRHGKVIPPKQVTLKSISLEDTKPQQDKLKINQSIEEMQTIEQTYEPQTDSKEETIIPVQFNNFVGDVYRSECLIYHKKYEPLLSNEEPKFLIDNMLKKLSSILRNCGLDAEYIAVRDYQLATAIAQKQHRIILTRDTKFFQRKDNKIPIYLIKQKTDCDKMFEEITQYFKVDLTKFKTLSRCVKCNGPELVIIDKEQAMNEIKFRYQDSTVNQFWRCTKCKQIYWEGGQFQRAKQKYANMKKH